MPWLHKIQLRFRALFQKEKLDEQMDDEMRSHIEMQTQENMEAGMKPEEARYAALRQFGRVEAIKETCRDQRGLPWLETLWQDLRYGTRQLRKNPGFTAVAVLTLALGIGANTAMFSIVNSVLLKALPYDDSGQLVGVWEAPQPGKRNSVSPGAFLDWREHTEVFDNLSLVATTEKNLTGKGDPERIKGVAMSASGLDLLRARPLFGRTFAPEEDQLGNNKVVVLAHGFWMRRFGGSPSAVGQTIQLNDETHAIIGVLRPQALLWEEAEFVIPATLSPGDRDQRSANWLHVMGRLKQGVTIEQAQAAMDALAIQLKPLYPAHKKDWGVTLVAMRDQITGDIKPTLLVLLGAVSFVLLIACGNVASLLLARASGRQKEMAIRAALGASRGRVIRQLLTENVVLSVAGGILGVLLAYWSLGAASQLTTAIQLPRVQEIGVDLRALGFALFVSVASGLVMGLFPALQVSRPDMNDTLKEGARGSAAGARSRVRGALIAAEVALSLMLLIGAGLLLNSFVRLSFVPPGINAENGLTLRIALPSQKYPDAERRAVFFEQVMERINGLPGVEYSGVTQTLPLAGYCPETTFSIGGPPQQEETKYPVDMDFCTAGYFQAVGIPLLKGRTFDHRDKPGSPGVVIINEALAREYFSNEDPLGKRLQLEPVAGRIEPGWEIVGIVGNVHQHGLTEPVKPCVYRPLSHSFIWQGGNLVIRSANDPAALARSVRQAVLGVDPSQPIANVQTLKEIVAKSVAQRRFILSLIGGFAGAALLLVAIGLYGILGYAVSQRTREIGVRMALGARRRDVVAMVIGQGMRIVAAGLALGLVGAFGLSHLLRGLLFGVTPTDWTTFVAMPLGLLVVTLLACWLPARRAAKVDPMVALRSE